LGEATVRNLLKAGAGAAILDMDDGRGQAIAAELGDGAAFFKADVCDEKSVQEALDGAVARFGAIHVVVNCAGVGTPMKVIGKQGPMPIEKFERVVRINLTGTMNIVRLGAEKMMKNAPTEDGERGVVINTASVAAFDGQVGQAAYAASKAAVVGMTLPITREFADYGIRVMTNDQECICDWHLLDKISEMAGYTLHWMKLRFGYNRYVYPYPVERDVMIGLKSAIRSSLKYKSGKELTRDALVVVLQDAGLDGAGVVESTYFSNCGMGLIWDQDMVRGHCMFAPRVEEGLFPERVPIVNVEGGCASGSMAFHLAWKDILSGVHDVSLAMGMDKNYHQDMQRVLTAFETCAHPSAMGLRQPFYALRRFSTSCRSLSGNGA
jgi:NADP-dependent 3-hydroxy acid dehydrogenase YdfG